MSLLKNSGLNFLGTTISAVIMVVSSAFFARTLDTESFGLLTLVLAFVGYASALDGGFARSVIREVAARESYDDEATQFVGTALRIVFMVGVFAALLVILTAPWLVELFELPIRSYSEAVEGFRYAAVTLPFVLVTMVWLAPLEARRKFVSLNVVRVIGFGLVFGSAVVAVLIMPSFLSAVIGILVGRVLMTVISAHVSTLNLGKRPGSFNRDSLKSLYRFGGWITISNTVTPLLDYLDRFVISIIVGVSGVAYYGAPADGVQKMQSLPAAVARSLFPILSARQREDNWTIVRSALALQTFIGLAAAIVLIGFSDQIITMWLGEAYAGQSSTVLKILAVGFIFNAVAWVPQTTLQAHGLAKQTTLIALVQVVPYIFLLVWLTTAFGLIGAAIAWSLRALGDLILLGWVMHRSGLYGSGERENGI